MTYGVEEATVRTMTYTESRARYAETLDAVVDDREEVIVTRAGHDSMDRLESGGGTVRELAE